MRNLAWLLIFFLINSSTTSTFPSEKEFEEAEKEINEILKNLNPKKFNDDVAPKCEKPNFFGQLGLEDDFKGAFLNKRYTKKSDEKSIDLDSFAKDEEYYKSLLRLQSLSRELKKQQENENAIDRLHLLKQRSAQQGPTDLLKSSQIILMQRGRELADRIAEAALALVAKKGQILDELLKPNSQGSQCQSMRIAKKINNLGESSFESSEENEKESEIINSEVQNSDSKSINYFDEYDEPERDGIFNMAILEAKGIIRDMAYETKGRQFCENDPEFEEKLMNLSTNLVKKVIAGVSKDLKGKEENSLDSQNNTEIDDSQMSDSDPENLQNDPEFNGCMTCGKYDPMIPSNQCPVCSQVNLQNRLVKRDKRNHINQDQIYHFSDKVY